MAQKTLIHKGYHGSIEVNTEDYSLFGKILFIDEDIRYAGQGFADLDDNFRSAVDEHIKDCLARGITPPFSE